MGAGPLVVTYPLTGRSRTIVEEELGGTVEAIYLVDLLPAARTHALRRAGAVLSHDTSKELQPDEIPLIRNARLLQFTAAGVDWVQTRDLPEELPVAANKGGGAEPMSEHIVALALAAAKRLFIEHANLKRGEFNQRSANRMLRGGVCGILGFGNVGVATARLMRAFGMKIHAINRRGASDEPTDWIATTDRLDEMLRVADVLVISAALTIATEGLICARELRLMKENAMLINVARGEIIDEGALYAHLVSHPHFFAGIRRVVGGASAAWPLRDGLPVSRPPERDRLAAQFSRGRGMARRIPPARCAELPTRDPWRNAAEPYRARRADALIDIGERLRITGLIFTF